MWEPTAEIQAAAAAPSRAIGCGGDRRGKRSAAPVREGTDTQRRDGAGRGAGLRRNGSGARAAERRGAAGRGAGGAAGSALIAARPRGGTGTARHRPRGGRSRRRSRLPASSPAPGGHGRLPGRPVPGEDEALPRRAPSAGVEAADGAAPTAMRPGRCHAVLSGWQRLGPHSQTGTFFKQENRSSLPAAGT
ncbi:ribosomal large subunit pseudouridine synthase B-like [Coturnix japonica]|uniref:ribosomal large subunit pseudouridine synthase B-like n=1 Tax=Coturnix japonica TaxID=93934 RepID=UPI0013A5D180|nr:ribosomal large subunit pseudouridine synthase B-like [Coturnix japonica]